MESETDTGTVDSDDHESDDVSADLESVDVESQFVDDQRHGGQDAPEMTQARMKEPASSGSRGPRVR